MRYRRRPASGYAGRCIAEDSGQNVVSGRIGSCARTLAAFGPLNRTWKVRFMTVCASAPTVAAREHSGR